MVGYRDIKCTHLCIHTLRTNTHTVFRKLTGDQAALQKIVWVLAHLCGIALGVYKFNAMGLLPTAPSDWLEFMEAKEVNGETFLCE